MRLNGLIFSHLYSAIVQHIRDNELSKEQKKSIATNSTSIWLEHQLNDTKKPLIYKLYLPIGTDVDYLVKKKSKLGVGTEYEEDVKDEVIVHCLETKMKHGFAKLLIEEQRLPRIKAAVLMQYFIKKNLPVHYAENIQYYHVFDEDSKKVLFKNLNRRKPKQQKEQFIESTIPRGRQIIHIKSHPKFHDYTLDYAKYDFIKFIKQYYQNLIDENYLDAFGMWLPYCQTTLFRNSIAYFKDLYYTPFNLRSKIEFFRTIVGRPSFVGFGNNINEKLIAASSLIFFEESIGIIHKRPNFDEIKLKDFDTIAIWLKEFRKKINRQKLFDIDEMSVRSFLTNVLDQIYTESDKGNIHPPPINCSRLYRIYSLFDGKKWNLYSVEPIYTHDNFSTSVIIEQYEVDKMCEVYFTTRNHK